MEAGEAVPPPQRQRRTAAVVAAIAMNSGERIIEQAIQPQQKKKDKQPEPRVSFDVGPIDVNLKSLLRKPSDSQKLAKRVKKKYSAKVKFDDKCRITVISPLPGWTAKKLRLPESDEEEDKSVENTSEKTSKKVLFPKTSLMNYLLITPESMKKLEQKDGEEFNKRLDFNAAMVFGDEAHPAEEEKKKKVVKKKKNRRLTTTQLNFPVVRDDSPDPPAVENPPELNPTHASVGRKASEADPNLEDSQSSATSCDSTLPVATRTVADPNKVHNYKASRAADWLANDYIDRSHDSTLEREDLLFRTANERSTSSSSEKMDKDDVFKEPEGRTTRSRRKSIANKKQAVESPPAAENIPPKAVEKAPVNSFFLPRSAKKAAEESSSESTKVIAKASRRKSGVAKKGAVLEKKPSPPPQSKSDESRSRSNRRRSVFVRPQEEETEEEKDEIVEVAVVEKLSSVKVRPSKRKSMFVDSKSKKALLSSEEDEEAVVEVEVEVEDDKKWKKAVHWNELDHAPVPKLHHTQPIRLFEPGETEHLPDLRMRIKIPRPVATVAGPFPSNPDTRPLPHMVFHPKTDEEIEEIVDQMDDDQRGWFGRLKGCVPGAPWTEAFAPKESAGWLGNPEIAKQTRDFVARWKKRVVREESEAKKNEGKKKKAHSDDSDYEEDSPIYENPLVLCGPTGSGKTALIASVAAELNMKILEVQPGEKRNGASLRQKLAGAMQSHLVQSGPSIASFFGGKKPAASDPPPKQKMQTLIVVEHVDVHFPDEDKDFWSALKDLASEAKVPVIWTCERFPAAELHREPAYDNWCQLRLHYNSVATVAGYVRCCLLASKCVDIGWEELKAFVHAYNCDLRAILANLQLQLASPQETTISFPPAGRPSASRTNAHESAPGYRTRQEALAAKRLQYQSIVRSVEEEREARWCQQRAMADGHCRLQEARGSMGILEPFRGLAINTIPYLVQMDAAERQRAQNNRRYQHYFNVVHQYHNNRQVDADGRLIPVVRQFSLPQ